MPISTIATYRGGVLEPAETLALKENERVRLTITQETGGRPSPDELHEQAGAWLAGEASRSMRPPLRVTAEERKELDAELDGIIAELHGRSRGINEREATRDVEEAMEAVRNA